MTPAPIESTATTRATSRTGSVRPPAYGRVSESAKLDVFPCRANPPPDRADVFPREPGYRSPTAFAPVRGYHHAPLLSRFRALTAGLVVLAVAAALAAAAGGPTVSAAPNARWCPLEPGAPKWARALRMTILVDSVLLSGKRAIRAGNRCRAIGLRGRPAWMIKHAVSEIGSSRRRVAPLVVIGIGYNSLFQRNRRRYDYWARRWDREAARLLRVLRRKGAKQFVWVTLREPTPRTVPRYAVDELRLYSWYFPYVNERLRRLNRRRDDVVLAHWDKVGNRPGITYDSIHLNARGGKLMARTIKRAINRETRRQARD
jgi:hypothetical protein